jgi:DNA-binding transcriptional MerR regulator
VTTQVTIGDFSRMTHLSMKTLRYYHRVGLLEPADVDEYNGYRYYSLDQVATAQVIRRFRDLDMPVDDVRAVLSAPDLAARNALISSHLGRLKDQLDRTRSAVTSLQNLLERPAVPTPIRHRTVPEMLTVAIAETVSAGELASWWPATFSELRGFLDSHGLTPAGPGGGLFANELFQDERGDAVLYLPAGRRLPASGRVRPMVLPAAELAIITHHGSHDDVDLSYGRLGSYVSEHALGVEGPIREFYLVDRFSTPDSAGWQTEIGWPIFQTAA